MLVIPSRCLHSLYALDLSSEKLKPLLEPADVTSVNTNTQCRVAHRCNSERWCRSAKALVVSTAVDFRPCTAGVTASDSMALFSGLDDPCIAKRERLADSL